MVTITFDPTLFRAMFPSFADTTKYPDALLEMYFGTATSYISAQLGGCYPFVRKMNLQQQTLALNQMTAHIAYLNSIIATGQNTGITTGATIDKISVTLMPPPAGNSWKFWLNQSPYGQALLALLEVRAAGGMFFTSSPPVVGVFRN